MPFKQKRPNLSCKEINVGREGNCDNLKLNSFRGLRLCSGEERIPEPVDITVLLGQGVRGFSGVILANCESSVLIIRGMKIHEVCT